LTHAELTEETRRFMTAYLDERFSAPVGPGSQERGKEIWERWLHPDVAYHVYGSFPGAGVYASRDEAMEKHQQPSLGRMKVGKRELDELLVDGNKAAVRYHLVGVTAIDFPYDQNYCFLYTVKDRRITEIHEFLDTELVHTAVFGMDNHCQPQHTCKVAIGALKQ
jgi:ketosteroid isomerase-like protein